MSKAKRDKEKKRRQKERARLNRKARESRAAALVSDVPKTGWEVTYWVVAFLDLMGYSNVLNGLDEFGPSRDGIDQEKYAAAYGRAHKIRKRFHAFLKPKPQDVTGELPWVDGIPESVKRLVLHSRRMRVIEAPGADHMVLILSMSPEVDHYPWRAFVAMLTTVSIAMIVQLAIGDEEPDNGLPVRGGIDVAPGSRIGADGFLYSPATARAYEIEDKQAIYPRVVFGPRIMEMIEEQLALPVHSANDRMQHMLATDAKNLLFVDSDGRLVLDFFGEELRRLLGDEPGPATTMAAKAWRAVTKAEQRYKNEGNARTASKYEWLTNYMQPRLGFWGIDSQRG